MMKAHSLNFTAPYQTGFEEIKLPALHKDEVLVKTICSGISAGSELLAYRGQLPEEMPADLTISALAGTFKYPLKYGYCSVGKIQETGKDVERELKGKSVFSFHPHQDYLISVMEDLIILPEEISVEDAIFIPNMETAVGLAMDGIPLIGENVLVFGQGVVGLLLTALLSRFPLSQLVTLDVLEKRRELSCKLGAGKSSHPDEVDSKALMRLLADNDSGNGDSPSGADLIFELSGNPAALQQTIELGGYDSRVIVGSWYGKKNVNLELGSSFHRNRIRVTSSQVSTLNPALRGRWTKKRRMSLVLNMIQAINPAQLVTHRFPFQDAAAAYRLLDQNPDEAVQVILTYPE